jgi:hypothetical protein
MNERLVAELRRQQGTLTTLLARAGVPAAEAEELLVKVLCERPLGEWDQLPDLEGELLARVRRACAVFEWSRCRSGRRRKRPRVRSARR